jgi:hypothetical protein
MGAEGLELLLQNFISSGDTDLLNQLKARRKKSRADLADVEAILGLVTEENGSN